MTLKNQVNLCFEMCGKTTPNIFIPDLKIVLKVTEGKDTSFS